MGKKKGGRGLGGVSQLLEVKRRGGYPTFLLDKAEINFKSWAQMYEWMNDDNSEKFHENFDELYKNL